MNIFNAVKQCALLLLAVFILAGCGRQNTLSQHNTIGTYIIPQINENHSRSNTSGTVAVESAAIIPQVSPKIPIDKKYLPIQIENVNLDFDRNDEQIIALKKRDANDSPIIIWVIDFDPVKNIYLKSWEAPIAATSIRHFTLSYEDLTGDHVPEIICNGASGERQTLDIFKKVTSPYGTMVYYKSIFSMRTDGTMKIHTKQRGRAYQNAQQSPVSFPVEVITKDPDSDNYLDLLSSMYYWKYDRFDYELVKRERIPGKKINEEKLSQIYSSGANELSAHLDGIWLKILTPEEPQNISKQQLLQINSRDGSVVFFHDKRADSFIWLGSPRKRLHNILLLYLQNDLIKSFENTLIVTINDLNNIKVSGFHRNILYRNDDWNGEYTRLSETIYENFSNGETEDPSTEVKDLDGVFFNDEGLEIRFNYPAYSFNDNDTVTSGHYFSFEYHDQHIIEFKSFDKMRITSRIDLYAYQYNEERKNNKIIKTLQLIPAVLHINAVIQDEDSIITLRQIVTID